MVGSLSEAGEVSEAECCMSGRSHRSSKHGVFSFLFPLAVPCDISVSWPRLALIGQDNRGISQWWCFVLHGETKWLWFESNRVILL